MKLADCLCNQYKQFYIKCKGKDAYLNFQIQWYDFLRCIASGVEIKPSKDSQVIDSDYEETPTFSAWASLVTAVSLKVDVVFLRHTTCNIP